MLHPTSKVLKQIWFQVRDPLTIYTKKDDIKNLEDRNRILKMQQRFPPLILNNNDLFLNKVSFVDCGNGLTINILVNMNERKRGIENSKYNDTQNHNFKEQIFQNFKDSYFCSIPINDHLNQVFEPYYLDEFYDGSMMNVNN